VQQDAAALDANRGRWRAAAEGAEEGDAGAMGEQGAGEEVWLAVESAEVAEGVAGVLDVRGVKEKELRAALEKVRACVAV